VRAPEVEIDSWSDLARTYADSGPPLRMSPEDAEGYAEAVALQAAERAPLRALLLGVTPDVHALPWPPGTDLVAVDRSPAMIERVWPGEPSAAHRADWTALPLPDASRDLAFCDGGLHLLDLPGQRAFASELARVVAPGGRVVLRMFVPPARRESVATVLDDLRAGRVRDVNVLKLRLGMAMQDDAEPGVRVDDVWRTFHGAEPDLDRFLERTRWTRGQVATVEAYRGSSAAYHFVTTEDARRLFERQTGGFRLERVRVPGYLLGERCPTVVFRRVPA
jgi:SAM-dependent methyltransferase